MAGNAGSMAQAARKAGYSDYVIDNPGKITNSQAFKSLYPTVLEKAGLTDEHLAEVHADMVNAITTEAVFFPYAFEKKKKKFIPADVDYIKKEIAARYPKRAYTLLENLSGTGITAYVQIPAHHYRGRGLELAYKNKGHMAPDKYQVDLTHTTTPEEMALINDILKHNGD